ncbi:MAG: hypothetical protein JW850_20675 [Thermoflexales bacterium]|nr:hypothetical protein [Thermoflexales bacterium]
MKKKSKTRASAATAAPLTPKSIAQKLRKLADTVQAVKAGERFLSITRLTSVKSLCQTHEAAMHFTLYLAERTEEKMRTESPSPYHTADELAHYHKLAVKSIAAMRAYLAQPSSEHRLALLAIQGMVQGVQNEVKQVGWNEVRIIKSCHLLVVENALCCFTSPEAMGIWAYQAASNYVERYDPHYGSGFTPGSIPMLNDIVTFWSEYYAQGEA